MFRTRIINRTDSNTEAGSFFPHLSHQKKVKSNPKPERRLAIFSLLVEFFKLITIILGIAINNPWVEVIVLHTD